MWRYVKEIAGQPLMCPIKANHHYVGMKEEQNHFQNKGLPCLCLKLCTVIFKTAHAGGSNFAEKQMKKDKYESIDINYEVIATGDKKKVLCVQYVLTKCLAVKFSSGWTLIFAVCGRNYF